MSEVYERGPVKLFRIATLEANGWQWSLDTANLPMTFPSRAFSDSTCERLNREWKRVNPKCDFRVVEGPPFVLPVFDERDFCTGGEVMSDREAKRVGDPGWFKVTEIVGGHTWGHVMVSMIPGECCRTCGMMRRRDKQNKPCRGKVRIELR